ncbi:hypothetical protein AeNC1_011378 [Aphanomyces euteiches]|nr:hypothetical protein AeNC1_011378 [Aphanomyces euteiches]
MPCDHPSLTRTYDASSWSLLNTTRMLSWSTWLPVAAGAVAVLADSSHKVTSLPNFVGSSVPFNHYAGQIELPSNGHKLFYWLVEASDVDPSTAPLVLWLNGGPGCSSLTGLFTELGPFIVDSDLKVHLNPYSWSRKANIVFLESPSGVGFSRPILDASEYNDEETAARTVEFLKQFYAMYPAYNKRDFYITGESYAGIYIPFLVYNLVKTPVANINLKGFAIGNPYTDASVDGGAQLDYFYAHDLISIESYHNVMDACPPSMYYSCTRGLNCTADCVAAINVALNEADFDFVDPYNVYGEVCLLNNTEGERLTHLSRSFTSKLSTKSLKKATSTSSTTATAIEIGPCHDNYMTAYLKLQSVQDAVHVTGGHIEWDQCADINYSRSRSALQKYPTILNASLKALIYSGDTDSVVNFLGTQRWISREGLNLTVVDAWKGWFGPDKQQAGYTTEYQNLTFMTVKGAGHMVPATKPLQALYMFECFVFGQKACANFKYPGNTSQASGSPDSSSSSTTPKTSKSQLVVASWALLVVLLSVSL